MKKGLIRLLIVLFSIAVATGTTHAAIPLDERNALIDIYTNLNGDSWTNNSGWKEPPLDADGFALPGTECSWHGIECDYDGDNIMTIALSYNNLSGTIPESIGSFSELQGLYLSGNGGITGSIPSTIGSLTNLRSLWFAYEQLTGPIPPEIGNLSSLVYLYLNSNQLSGSIPPELGNLSNLREMYLMGNELEGAIPPELGNLSSLQTLNLGANNLSGPLPVELENMTNLNTLALWNNQLSEPIPPEIGNLSNLEYLYLGTNQFSDAIPDALENLPMLKTMDLSNNQLSGSIPVAIFNISTLEYLQLQGNQLTGGIPAGLNALTNLQSLWLARNPLGGTIPLELGDLSNLTQLYLESTQLTGTIPSELGNLANLNVLSLNENQLTGQIPSSLGNLTQLQYLYLDQNQLTGPIPAELGNLVNLSYLMLDRNNLTGNLPPELGDLASINIFSLYDNSLTGTIPAELGNLSTMTYLNLQGNALGGEIPSTLTNLTNLYNNNNSIAYNALYTDDAVLKDFLNTKMAGGDFWERSQTIVPSDFTAGTPTDTSIPLTWTAIPYEYQAGGYEIYYSMNTGGPYALFETTADKTIENSIVTGLSPDTTYYLRLRTVTYSHSGNKNDVYSEYTGEISAKTAPGTVVLNPDIDVFPSSLAFGDVMVGGSLTLGVTILNIGDANLEILNITMSGSTDFSQMSTCSASLPPGGTCDLFVTFIPSTGGPHSATLTVDSNDPDEPSEEVSLTGNGMAPAIDVSPASIDFGDIVVGNSDSDTVTVSNTGSTNLNITNISIIGSSDFNQTNTCSTVSPSSSCAITVTFVASAAGAQFGTLQIESNDPDEPLIDVSLTANSITSIEGVWHTETIDTAVDTGYFPSINLSPSGLPHITYFDRGTNIATYAFYDGIMWNIESLAPAEWNGHLSSRMDASGYLHMSYQGFPGSLTYAKFNEIDLDTVTIDSTGAVGFFTSISLNSAGNPHISYVDATLNDLKYAYYDGSNWYTQIADPSLYPLSTSIALDTDEYPHISYNGFADVKYAHYNGSVWQNYSIESGGFYRSSIAVDASGNPHICYSDSGVALKYASYNGSAWNIEIVESGVISGLTSIVMDSLGKPHISYYSAGNLKYAHYNGTVWQIETVDSSAFVGYHSSIILDASDNPLIAYLDLTNKNLKYARRSMLNLVESYDMTTNEGPVTISISEGSFSESPQIVDPEGVPDGFLTPYGAISFMLETNVGATVTVMLTFPEDLPTGAVLMKCQDGTCAAITEATISGNKVIFNGTDGGELDKDHTQNGLFEDPCVLAVPVNPDIQVDIKPGSTQNPVNVKSKGVLPVALLGTETFDVTQVDPVSIQLEGMNPARWEYEDTGSDENLDMILKFDTQKLIEAIEKLQGHELHDGELIVLHLTGNLKATHGSALFTGEDVIIIKK